MTFKNLLLNEIICNTKEDITEAWKLMNLIGD